MLHCCVSNANKKFNLRKGSRRVVLCQTLLPPTCGSMVGPKVIAVFCTSFCVLQKAQVLCCITGKGLGKKENGRSDPIKVKIKADTAGVGKA